MASLVHNELTQDSCSLQGDYAAAEEWFFKALKIDHQRGSVYQHYGE